MFYITISDFSPTQGTDIITLLNTVHNDPSQFQTPQEFNPEHFLDANQSFKNSPAFMPFSAGENRSQSLLSPNFTLQTLPLLHPTHPQLWMHKDSHFVFHLSSCRQRLINNLIGSGHCPSVQ
jgi:hypothetical protein